MSNGIRKNESLTEQREQRAILNRITSDPLVLGGLPCIRGLPVAVQSIMGLLRDQVPAAEILSDYPYLEEDDIKAAVLFASERDLTSHNVNEGHERKPRPNHQRTLRCLRAMTPSEKLDQVFKLNERTITLFRIGLRRRFPDLNEAEFEKLYLQMRARWHNRNY